MQIGYILHQTREVTAESVLLAVERKPLAYALIIEHRVLPICVSYIWSECGYETDK